MLAANECHGIMANFRWISELKQRRRWRQQERQKNYRVRLAKKQLCTCITLFWYISLPSLYDYDVKIPNFTFCGVREHKVTTFFFFLWTSIQSFRIQLQKICQHLTNWTSWNKHDKAWGSATSLFKWRFRSRRRRCCCLISLTVQYNVCHSRPQSHSA